MERISFGQIRWVGWAALCSIEHPEVGRLQDWVNHPEQVAGLIGMYFLFGLVLEFTYRKLVWGSIWPKEEGVSAQQSECVEQGWTSFVDQKPPEDCPLDILCADGNVRKGKAIATSLDGRLIFEIEYEMEIKKQQKEDPMRFAPKYWRQSHNMSHEKGDLDVF